VPLVAGVPLDATAPLGSVGPPDGVEPVGVTGAAVAGAAGVAAAAVAGAVAGAAIAAARGAAVAGAAVAGAVAAATAASADPRPARATALNRVSGASPPITAVSVIRRTCTSAGAMLSAMPPGVQVCSFGTFRTARGSPRGGSRAADTAAPACSSGVHHRGGATAERPVEPTRIASVAASARRTTTGRAAPAANRVVADASMPIEPVRRRPVRGPGKRSRRPTSRPSDASPASDVSSESDVSSGAAISCRPSSAP
jgi:hypothetical protein